MPTVSNLLAQASDSLPVLRNPAFAKPRLPRVLFVATTETEGGIERYSIRLAAQLRARGAPLRYACRPGSRVAERCAESGVPALPLRVRNSGDLIAAMRLARVIARQAIDIVHVHSRRDYVPGLLAVGMARLLGYPARLLLHAHLIRPLGEPPRLSGRLFARGADGVIAVSSAVRDYLLARHDLDPRFVQVLHNGIDVSAFAPVSCAQARAWRAEFRDRWAIAPEAPVIGMVGRLDAKGQEALLAAAPRLIARVPDLRIVLTGPESEPGSAGRLVESASQAGLAGRVVFTGSQENIPAVMAAFDVLAHLPSDESFGLALVEAMAAGLPTVVTAIGGCVEVVQEGITGRLVPLGDPEALFSALSWLLDPQDGAARRVRMGAAGREAALCEFSLPCQVDQLLALYQTLLPGQGA